MDPYGTDMVVRRPDSFFGTPGAIIAGMTGLTAEGYDGTQTPIFRTNLFDQRDPSMTGLQYAMSDAYSRRMADIQNVQRFIAGNSVDRLFDGNSAMGSFMYQVDKNGNYVQAPGAIEAFNAIRRFATTNGADMTMSALNGVLGYDRGAGAGVFNSNANMMVSSLPVTGWNRFRMNANGEMSYNPGEGYDSDRYQATRAVMAGIMQSGLQEAMYGGGLLKNWDTTHGVSEGLSARIISDAVAAGRFNKPSEMTAEDKELQRSIDRLDEEIRQNNSRIESNNRLLKEELDPAGKAAVQTDIDRLQADNARKESEKASLRGKMSSYSWGGDLGALLEEAMMYESQASEIQERLGGKDGKGGLQEEARSLEERIRGLSDGDEDAETKTILTSQLTTLNAQISEEQNRLKETQRKIQDVGKRSAEIQRAILSEVTGAVDVAKNLYGNEQDAYNALYAMTGSDIVKEGVAKKLTRSMGEFIEVGNDVGMSGQAMNTFLTANARSFNGTPFQGSAIGADMALFFATAGAKAVQASGKKDQESVAAMMEGARARGQSFANSTASRVLVQLEAAREGGALSDRQYQEIRASLMSGNKQTMTDAQNKLYRIMYGDVREGVRRRDDLSGIEEMRRGLSKKGADSYEEAAKEAIRNETLDSQLVSNSRSRMDRAFNDYRRTHVPVKQARQLQAKERLNGMRKELELLGQGKGGPGGNVKNEEALAVTMQMDEMYDRLVGDGMSGDEASRRVVEWFDKYGSKRLGSDADYVLTAGMNQATSTLRSYTDAQVHHEFSDKTRSILSENEGALLEGGERMSLRNMSTLGDVLFGDSDTARQIMDKGFVGKEQAKRAADARRAYLKAMQSGDVVGAARIIDEFISGAGSNVREMIRAGVKSEGGFITGDALKKRFDKGGFSWENDEDVARWLKEEGLAVNHSNKEWAKEAMKSLARNERTDEVQEEVERRRAEAARKAYEKSAPMMEALTAAMTGHGSVENVFKNGGVKDEDFKNGVARLAAMTGSMGSVGGTDFSLASMFGDEFFRDEWAGMSDGAAGERSQFKQNLIKEVAGMDLAGVTQLSMLMSGQGEDGKQVKAVQEAFREYQGADADDKDEKLKNLLDALGSAAAAGGKLAGQDEKTGSRYHMGAIFTQAGKMLDDHSVSIEGTGVGGGLNGEKLDALLDRIGTLIDVLKAKEKDPTYR